MNGPCLFSAFRPIFWNIKSDKEGALSGIGALDEVGTAATWDGSEGGDRRRALAMMRTGLESEGTCWAQ
jgi:hypothetical protein